jgi:hypothetical protein
MTHCSTGRGGSPPHREEQRLVDAGQHGTGPRCRQALSTSENTAAPGVTSHAPLRMLGSPRRVQFFIQFRSTASTVRRARSHKSSVQPSPWTVSDVGVYGNALWLALSRMSPAGTRRLGAEVAHGRQGPSGSSVGRERPDSMPFIHPVGVNLMQRVVGLRAELGFARLRSTSRGGTSHGGVIIDHIARTPHRARRLGAPSERSAKARLGLLSSATPGPASRFAAGAGPLALATSAHAVPASPRPRSPAPSEPTFRAASPPRPER